MSSMLVWDCYQSLTKLAKHDSVQPMWVLGTRKGNDITDQLPKPSGSQCPFIGPHWTLDLLSRPPGILWSDTIKHNGNPHLEKDMQNSFLESPLLKEHHEGILSGVELQLQSLTTLAPDACEWSASCPSCFTFKETDPGTH